MYGVTVLAGFLLAVAAAWMPDVHLNAELDRLDFDGGIGGSELTQAAQRVMDDWASDTGRTMVIVTGLPLSAVWYGMCFPLVCLVKWIVDKAMPGEPAVSQHADSTEQ